MVFNFTGSFHLYNQYEIGKVLRASSILLHYIFKYEIKPSIALQLVDTFAGSVLTIGCLVCGFTKFKDIERVRVQITLCKYVLGVKQTTPNAAVYGKLDVYSYT